MGRRRSLGQPGTAAGRRSNRARRARVRERGPVTFKIDGRQFVTIFDNARRPNIVVYRAEKFLEDGERRLFVEKRPFGNDKRVSDENSLIVYPVPQSDKVRIYAENNWGNRSLISTAGPLVTRPGLGGIEVDSNGLVRVLPRNRRIRVPSVVSKGNVHDGLLYTYNKIAGWLVSHGAPCGRSAARGVDRPDWRGRPPF